MTADWPVARRPLTSEKRGVAILHFLREPACYHFDICSCYTHGNQIHEDYNKSIKRIDSRLIKIITVCGELGGFTETTSTLREN